MSRRSSSSSSVARRSPTSDRCSRTWPRSRADGPWCSSTAAASASPSGSSGSASRAGSRAACGSPMPSRSRSPPRCCAASSTASSSPGLRDLGVDAVGLSGVDGGLLDRRADPGARARRHASPASGATCSTRSSSAARSRSSRRSPATPTGIVCNVNADDAAAGIAAGLGARQLVLLTDVDGVRDADGRKLDTLTVAEAEHLIETGVIAGGMVPKVRAALVGARLGGRRGDHRRRRAPSAPSTAPSSDPAFGTRITAGAGGRRGVSGAAMTARARSSSGSASGRSASSSHRDRCGSQRELVDALDDAGLRRDPGDGQPRHHRARAAQGAARRRARLHVARGRRRRERRPGMPARRRARLATSGSGGSSPTCRSRSAGAG